MAVLSLELKYALEEITGFKSCFISSDAQVYSDAQITQLITEFNKDLDLLSASDSRERDHLDAGGKCGLFKNRQGMYVYLFGFRDEGYPVPLFISYTNQYALVLNDELKGKDIGKVGIFLAWLAEKHAWNRLELAYCGIEPDIQNDPNVINCHMGGKQYDTPAECGRWLGSVYEHGSWSPADIGLTTNTNAIQMTIKDYIQGDPALQQILRNAGGIAAGAHLIPDYIIQQRLSGAINSKTFRDVAVQVNALVSAYGIVNPTFDDLCKLMGIEE